MTALHKITPPEFIDRTEDCAECGGSGVRAGFRGQDVGCHDCDGTGEWDAVCVDCGEVHPLNSDGLCRSCDASLTGITAENVGDPFERKRRAA